MRKRGAVGLVVAAVVLAAGCKGDGPVAPATGSGSATAGSGSATGSAAAATTDANAGSAAGSGSDAGSAAGSGSAPGPGSAGGSAAAAPDPAASKAFVGAWKLDAVKTKDGPVPKSKLAKGGMTWEFKPDGGLDMSVWADGQKADAKATWTVDGDIITIVENGQTNQVKFSRKGAKLILAATASSVVMTFKPVK